MKTYMGVHFTVTDKYSSTCCALSARCPAEEIQALPTDGTKSHHSSSFPFLSEEYIKKREEKKQKQKNGHGILHVRDQEYN